MAESRIVLFGGQGSRSIFSSTTAKAAQHDAESTIAGSIVLSKCHAAFLQEISSLDVESRRILDIDPTSFNSPGHLLEPEERYHTHPVLQATTIFLCHVLRYLTDVSQQHDAFEQCFDKLETAAGFSSGIIPAAIVARSPTIDEFVTCAVEGFRLAFWVAYHSFRWTLINASDDGENISQEATMSLATRGLSREQVEQVLKRMQTEHGLQQIVISSIAISGSVSISGPQAELIILQEYLGHLPDVTTTFAHVYGWYHGGEQLEPVVRRVEETISRRCIRFPPCSRSPKSVYSTSNGTSFDSSKGSADELLSWLTRHLLLHCVDWHETGQAIATDIQSILQRKPTVTVKVLSFGPSSASLFPAFESQNPRIKCVDKSSFKPEKRSTGQPSDRPNDIAIVGMSVQLPKGQGTDELWETLSGGLNAVQEIPESRLKLSDYYTDEKDKPRSMATRHGAFLNDPFR
jgi:malonyl CoA-acyl carrier protein transacylase